MSDLKNIVICSDGTGNTAIKARGTNVFKIFEAVDICGHTLDPSLKRQLAIYDDGVGTSNLKPCRLLCGAFGWGLSKNVKELYRELARVYEPQDDIYLFGFSRGAFTVRTLADLIATCGIVACDNNEICLEEDVNKVYREYRRRYRTIQGQFFNKLLNKNENIPRNGNAYENVHIRFVGVWDTVDAVGLPFAGLATFINNFVYRYKFPDLKLSLQVKKACHALSIDDERLTFHPEMWDEKGEKPGRIEQVWFPGVHANVGGGYPKQGLSLVSLYWMMKKAHNAGLRFSEYDWSLVRDHQHPFDKLYDSRAGLAVYYRYKPRNMVLLCEKNSVVPKIHISAIERISQGSNGYAPGNIPAKIKIEITDSHCSDLSGLTDIIERAVHPDKILMDRAKDLIFARKACHVILVGLTAAFLCLLARNAATGPKGVIKGVFGLFSGELLANVLTVLQRLPLFGKVTLAAAAGLLLAGSIALRRSIKSIFSSQWYKVRTELQQKLS